MKNSLNSVSTCLKVVDTRRPAGGSVRGKRDFAMLALLLGCGLRRSELVHLTMEHLQQREEHWAIIDLVGKGGHVRTVPIPAWVKEAIDIWSTTANIKTGKLFRCVNKTGSIWGRGITEKVVWCMVRECASGPRRDAPSAASERNIPYCINLKSGFLRGKIRLCEVSMRVKAIEHVQLAMPPGKESEARNFYEGVLGIPEVPKPANLAKRGGCWFVRDTLKIHLGVENEFRAARKAHPALLVEDLPALKTRIETAGYSVNTDEPLEGYDRIYVDDPFGNRIELMEPLSD